MVTGGRVCRCKYCGKSIQFIRSRSGRMVPINPGIVHFHRCDTAYSYFYDLHGSLVRGYKEDESGELGYRPHNPATNCFVWPWEQNGKAI